MLRSLGKVFAIIDSFTPEQPQWTLADLSRKLGIPKPTVHHIMASLIEGGWIHKDDVKKRYSLGVRLWEKGWLAVNQVGVRDVARPFVEELVRECGETARVGILDPVDPRWVTYIELVEGQHAVRADMGGTMRAPSHCVATGKAMLAHNPELVKRLAGQALKSYTPGTLTAAAALVRDLDLTRERGYSINQCEYRADVVGVGAPIRNHAGKVVAAIGISGPAYRLGPSVVRRVGPVVAATARRISQRIGNLSEEGIHEENLASRARIDALGNGNKRAPAKLPHQADRSARGLRGRGRQ